MLATGDGGDGVLDAAAVAVRRSIYEIERERLEKCVKNRVKSDDGDPYHSNSGNVGCLLSW